MSTLTSAGYLRIKERGPDRDKLEHRRVMEKLLGCTDPQCPGCNRRAPIPEGLTVHHQDLKRDHNCPGNLTLLAWPLNVLGGEERKIPKQRERNGRWATRD